jgi:hypothetical protein
MVHVRPQLVARTCNCWQTYALAGQGFVCICMLQQSPQCCVIGHLCSTCVAATVANAWYQCMPRLLRCPRRYRLVRLVCPVLRLVLSLLGGAPGSAKMVSEALEFCRGQHKLLGRLLKEAAAPGNLVAGLQWSSVLVARWCPPDSQPSRSGAVLCCGARMMRTLYYSYGVQKHKVISRTVHHICTAVLTSRLLMPLANAAAYNCCPA